MGQAIKGRAANKARVRLQTVPKREASIGSRDQNLTNAAADDFLVHWGNFEAEYNEANWPGVEAEIERFFGKA